MAAPRLDELRNATFSGVLDQPIRLKGGVYEGPPFVEGGASRPHVILWEDVMAVGDLDGLPGEEAAVVLSENSGGSGERVHIAAIGARGKQLINLGTALVGDRTQIRELRIVERRIVMDVVEAGPRDGLCCPTQLARKSYALHNGLLQRALSEATGTLSLATLTGTEWTLVELDHQLVPAGIRAPTARFEATRIAGFGGCNYYTGEVKETGPGGLTLGPLAGTKRACPQPEMALEVRFLARLARVNRYTFLAGRLALGGSEDTSQGMLVFTGKPASSAGGGGGELK